ncbi:MAG: intradiol ring-cleavage dioxygenase [Betaproteobacteria bacterium RIFCSPLOWO2_12_FULL_62_58]|nr:MAG: intradiol ring-cleavage dioxygenase [Betaproteobacteria bacterium RIFCSPLOWO2_02_FULL_62_79]OGA53511.1 MAG: intradiol ring-cleavage dioxygenase [Betaproteobacteria bacterium RIFCSPLOWO2_12_FULL_62_58]
MNRTQSRTGRRRFLGAALALPLVSIGPVSGQTLPLTPTCGEKPERTPSQTAGPFYTPDSPRRSSLVEPGSKAERLVLAGVVLSPQCKPAANALLDFWHCDEAGEYDNRGFRYRGHVFADTQGRYSLETIVPGEYPGRTRHIHVKVQAPGGRVLTTQLYFPDEPHNRSDGIYRRELTMQVARKGEQRDAKFNFVVAV